MKERGTLIFFCGKMGAGKSTKAKLEASSKNAVLLSEDEWLLSLYPEDISSIDDYLKYSARLKPLVKKIVQDILLAGTNVVMDFPANTQSQRKWFLDLARGVNVHHKLFYLNIDNEQCLRQIGKRRTEQPDRAAFDTESTFYEMAKYFEEPKQSEAFNIEVLVSNS